MKNISSTILKSLDYFSQPIQITFDRERNFSTILGGFLSLIIYCVTIALIISSANNLLYKINPKTTTTETYLNFAPLLNLKNQSLIYGIGFMDRNFERLKDDSLYTIEFSQFKRERQPDNSVKTEYISMNKTSCQMYQQEFINRGFEAEYKALNLDQIMCFDNQVPGVILGGDFNLDYYSNLNVRMKRCVNSTKSKTVCKSSQEIDNRLLNGYFQFYYFNSDIDLNNYDDPYKMIFSNSFIVTDPKATKFSEVYFKTVNISTDAGLVFESNEYKSDILYDTNREQILVQVVDDLIIDFYINSSKNYFFYTRIYLKFQDFAANIGGLLKVMTVLGYFISIKFTHYEMYEKMFNSLYKFDFNEGDRRKKINFGRLPTMVKTHIEQSYTNKNLSVNDKYNKSIASGLFRNNYFKNEQNQDISKTQHKSSTNQISTTEIISENYKRKIINQIRSLDEKYDKKINLGPLEIFKMYLCRCCSRGLTSKYNLFNLAYNKIQKHFDYLLIIQTLQQVHRLKNILFNKTQKKLFLLHNRPLISQNKKKVKPKNEINNIFEAMDESELIYESYLKAKKKQGSNKFYKRLLQEIDENLKRIFDHDEKN